jgi:hypothetical protein
LNRVSDERAVRALFTIDGVIIDAILPVNRQASYRNPRVSYVDDVGSAARGIRDRCTIAAGNGQLIYVLDQNIFVTGPGHVDCARPVPFGILQRLECCPNAGKASFSTATDVKRRCVEIRVPESDLHDPLVQRLDSSPQSRGTRCAGFSRREHVYQTLRCLFLHVIGAIVWQ